MKTFVLHLVKYASTLAWFDSDSQTAHRLRMVAEEQCSASTREELGAFLKMLYDHLFNMANSGDPVQRSGCIKVSIAAVSAFKTCCSGMVG